MLEAAACRCPIVCTRTAGTEKLLPDDTHGIVLPGQPQDATVETIRAGLQTLLDDPARAHACAEAAYRNVYAHFTWDAVFDKMMGMINQELTSARCLPGKWIRNICYVKIADYYSCI